MIEYILNRIKCIVNSGFDNKEQAFNKTKEMIYEYFIYDNTEGDEIPTDTEIINAFDSIYDKYLQTHSNKNFGKLSQAFDILNREKIIALHNAGGTLSDGFPYIAEVLHRVQSKGITPIGFCFYHSQDMERAMSEEDPQLSLCFGSIDETEDKSIFVGEKIYKLLVSVGFKVSWNHTYNERIKINNFKWDKIYDENGFYFIGRAVKYMTETY